MPAETVHRNETASKPEYSHKSFELVFANFCKQYKHKIEAEAGPKAKIEDRFLGLPGNASVQEMGKKFAEITAAIGEPAQLEPGHGDEVPLKDAVILSARHLAWSSVMSGITCRYIERIDSYIDIERHGGRSNNQRLFNERRAAVNRKIGNNNGIRDYFNSGLAELLGNDSPEGMIKLMEHAPYMSDSEKSSLVSGISLEIAAKNELESRGSVDYKVAFGSPEQDAVGGDLVVIGKEDILFIDLKSSMPVKFAGGETSTYLDEERGYKWLEGGEEGRQVVVWAYSKQPVSPNKFVITDDRLAANLVALANSAALDKTNV